MIAPSSNNKNLTFFVSLTKQFHQGFELQLRSAGIVQIARVLPSIYQRFLSTCKKCSRGLNKSRLNLWIKLFTHLGFLTAGVGTAMMEAAGTAYNSRSGMRGAA